MGNPRRQPAPVVSLGTLVVGLLRPTPLVHPPPVRWHRQRLWPSGPTFSAVVSEEQSGAGFKPPPAPTKEAPAASQGASASGCWSDLAPYGSVSIAGMMDLGFQEHVKGILEGTGSPAVDQFGRAFREEANSFMWRLWQRSTQAYKSTLERVEEEARVTASNNAQQALSEMKERLVDLQVEHNYFVEQLQESLGLYQTQDREFYQVFGLRLSTWATDPNRHSRELRPRQAEVSREMSDYLHHGICPGGLDVSRHPPGSSP